MPDPELKIKGVIDLSGVRQDLATLQAQAERGISVGGTATGGPGVAGTFAGEGARSATAAGIAAPAPISSIAPNVYQSPALAGPIAAGTPMQAVAATFQAAGWPSGVGAWAAPAGAPAGAAPGIVPTAALAPPFNLSTIAQLGQPYGGPPPMPTSAGAAGGGGGSFLPVGRGLTAVSAIHALSMVVRNEETYGQRIATASGSPAGIAQAELRHRTDYDSLFFGVGRIGRAISEVGPGPSAGDVESILSSAGRQDEQLSQQERSLGFFRGLSREADVATAPRGTARHFAQIDAKASAERDKLQTEIRAERDSETSRYNAAVAAVTQQRDTAASRQRTGRQMLGPLGFVLPVTTTAFDESITGLGREHDRLSGIISGREAAGITQINSIEAAEKQEAKEDVAAQRVGIIAQTHVYSAIASGARGRALDAYRALVEANAQVTSARIRNDPNLPDIEARRNAQVAAANVETDHARQLEQFRLRADTMVSKLGAGGGTAAAHLAAAAAAGQAGVLAADPEDVGLAQGAASARYQGALGEVVRGGAAQLAAWVRRRTAEGNAARRDVFHTAELQAQQNVAELQAAGRPVAAGIAGIVADTNLAVKALKTDDPEYTRQRDALRGLGVARLRAYQNSLADAGQAVEVAPGTTAPGVGAGRYDTHSEDIGKQIADAIKEAMGAGGNATGGSGNMFQQISSLVESVNSLKSVILGG